ncbi:MAG: hypothetical protein JXA99_10625 [Candidatus Lokiarchaeota archaeon]|nr:hypothetical protein [Candidatus Lokiarchaeota archaeon]
MPLEEKHIIKFLENPLNERYNSEILTLLIKRIRDLCFKECQVDRITCTLTPMCTRRFLLKLRIKNGLTMEDLPKFCYSVNKGVIERYFRGKTVVYKPFDSYLYLIDFLDIFFHGDYRKLNKYISFKNWKATFNILDERINNGENFTYHKTENYILINHDEKIHIIYLESGYVLCNAHRESITDLELIKGIFNLNARNNFPEISLKTIKNKKLILRIKIPYDIISKISSEFPSIESNNNVDHPDNYFWNTFPDDLIKLSDYCKMINLIMDYNEDLLLTLVIDNKKYTYTNKRMQDSLKYRDLIEIIKIISFIYNKFYVIWI